MFFNNTTTGLIEYPGWNVVFDTEGGAAEGGAAEGGAVEGGAVEGGTTTKTFTQDELNTILAKEKREGQQKLSRAMEEIKSLQSKASLTAEERAELDKTIKNLNDTLKTKEELAKEAQNKLQKKLEKEIADTRKELDTWKTRYNEETIVRAITDGAATNNAFHPVQLVAILKPMTELVEILDDDGKPTNKYKTVVNMVEDDKTLSLSVDDAIKRMKESDVYYNLFKPDGTGGIGRINKPGGQKLNPKDFATDPEQYRKWRKENGYA